MMSMIASSTLRQRQGPRDRLQWFALGCDAPNRLDDGSQDHEPRTKQIAAENAGTRAGFNQVPKQERRSHPANGGAGCVKKGDGQRRISTGKISDTVK